MRWTQFLIVCLVAGVTSVIGGAATFGVLEGRKIDRAHESASFKQLDVTALRIVDASGKLRAGLAASDGMVGLIFFSDDGKQTVSLSDFAGRRELALADGKNLTRVLLSAANNVAQIAVLYGEGDESRKSVLDGKSIGLAGPSGGTIITDEILAVRNIAENKSVYVAAGDISVWGGEKGPHVGLSGSKERASLSIFDVFGGQRAVVGTVDTVNKKTEAVTKSAESQITLFDKDGNVIHSIP